MNILERKTKKGDKIVFYYDFGRGPGQRPSSGIFIYTAPKNATEKAHNKEALALLDVKKSEAIIEQQAVGTDFIPKHKFFKNFLEYYEAYIQENSRKGNRHLQGSFRHFKLFLKRDFIHPVEITETLCKRFRRHLLDTLHGETPGNYFTRFRWVVSAATSDGYFKNNPVEKVFSQKNPSNRFKENLESYEYIELLNTPCTNEDVQLAFIFCCYTGLRWVDVKSLKWKNINGQVLITNIIQQKTGRPVSLTLHPIAQSIIKRRCYMFAAPDPNATVFRLPTANGANKILESWIANAGIEKHITWSCARLSFSILLKDKHVDDATIACLMGHTTTRQVQNTYRRHRPKNQEESISRLPAPDIMPYYLNLDE